MDTSNVNALTFELKEISSSVGILYFVTVVDKDRHYRFIMQQARNAWKIMDKQNVAPKYIDLEDTLTEVIIAHQRKGAAPTVRYSR